MSSVYLSVCLTIKTRRTEQMSPLWRCEAVLCGECGLCGHLVGCCGLPTWKLHHGLKNVSLGLQTQGNLKVFHLLPLCVLMRRHRDLRIKKKKKKSCKNTKKPTFTLCPNKKYLFQNQYTNSFLFII